MFWWHVIDYKNQVISDVSFIVYNFIIMQGNFNINLPSIPGAILKFKIQDVRFKGFLSKEARFKDNKTYLTKRFINSFPNLQSKPQSQTLPQENKSQLSTNLSSFFRKEEPNYRIMVPNEKKNLLIKYQDQYKYYTPPISGENKYDKGYSFQKQGLKSTLDGEIRKYQSQIMNKEDNSQKIDNYYFNQTENSEEQDYQLDIQRRREEKLAKRKQLRPSAAFKGENRWEQNERILRSKIKPGPGEYINQSPKPIRKPTNNKKKGQLNPQNIIQSIQKIKDVLKDYRDCKHLPSLERSEQKKDIQNYNHFTSSFAEGNLDRFGQPKYPISLKVNIPPPGQYETHGSLQEKARKILILQQQRKLLKEWYNQ